MPKPTPPTPPAPQGTQYPDIASLISDVRIFPLDKSDSKTLAFATIEIAGQFAVKNVRIVDGANGLFVAMPQEYNKRENKYYDVCNPITAEARALLDATVLEAYQEATGGAEDPTPPTPPARPARGTTGAGRGAVGGRR